ncbi:MAG TPA: aspartyl protease family protein [Casimicrobiaceae bacterium]
MNGWTRIIATMSLALAGSIDMARAHAVKNDVAPSGTAVLGQARAAAGGPHWDALGGLHAEGRIELSRLPGSWSRDEDLSNGRFAVRSDVGVFRVAEGFDGRTRWRQDRSGGIHPLNGTFSKQATATDAWLTKRGWLRPDADGAAVGHASARVENGRGFVVVDIVPRGGQSVQLWFDAKSHRLDRTVRTMPISTLTVRYGDYRPVAGLQLPFRIESRDSSTSDVETVRVERWTSIKRVDDGAFTAPAPPDDSTLDGKTTVPLDIDGMVVVSAKLEGRAFDFILDTGGHNIVTPAVVQALGLHPAGLGASGGAGAGELPEQYVRVDRLEVGAATMRDQHFYVLPLQYGTVERGPRPPLAGLIGVELFERFQVRLDYPGKALTLRKIAGRERRVAGHVVSITFDDDMPLIEGRIDGIPALMALDTGNASTTVVQAVWARKHGLAQRLKRGIETVSYGAGGASSNWASRIDSLEIGGTVLKRPVVRYAEDKAGAFSSITEAANIGTDALANFILDFDYANNVIGFTYVPGFMPLPFNRAGLRAIKEGVESFRVALALPDSPAARAGLERDDQIVTVDDVDAAQMSGRDLVRKLTQAPGSEVALRFRHGDALRETRLKLEELLP